MTKAKTNPIGWCDETWNPLAGCTKVSSGCVHCYAETMARRLKGMALAKIAKGQDPGRLRNYIDTINDAGKWSGKVVLDEQALTEPLRWREPRLVFVNSMSDLFHEDVPFEFVDDVFGVMDLCPQHWFMVLTKRPGMLSEYIAQRTGCDNVPDCVERIFNRQQNDDGHWWYNQIRGKEEEKCFPIPNVILGTSVEEQKTADERIPHLLKLAGQGWRTMVSAEPLLGPIDFSKWMHCGELARLGVPPVPDVLRPPQSDWLIVGGESGPKARPCKFEWIESIVEQCKAAGVACYVKQIQAWTCPVCGWIYDSYPEFNSDECDSCTEKSRRVMLSKLDDFPAILSVREFPAFMEQEPRS